ncbi:Aureobasidin resistance protein Aur1 [Modicella reniformis]|uniref:Aureobasidin resistance protein Aur1 n=1 Tax=Modicella reniformis TaxID=1440133 RepID=A0A9P6IYS4_9FUNG|nr:Aureobasidin resistance protein Aur1 [Modicella reniformis]
MLASTTSPFKDILAWIPYGVMHYVMPIITAILIVFFGPPGTLPLFARTFGYMNIAGVMTQILFPCAPPWYETRYGGLQPAAYSMPGDPGGLARVDDILGVKMYGTTFTASPLVFGAFPSLHSADAVQIAFFLVYVFGPRTIPIAVGYVFWIWWATMYLGHHYVVDLVGGGAYAVVAFWIASFFLPSVLPPSQQQQDGEHLLHSKGNKKGVLQHDLGAVMDRKEKQTLFRAPCDDYGEEEEEEEEEEFEGHDDSSSSRGRDLIDNAWDLEQQNDEEIMERGVDITEMNSIVINIPARGNLEVIEEASLEPSSPTGSHHSSTSSSSSSSSTTIASWTQRMKKQATTKVATTSTTTTSSSSYRQSWNGWQGYEVWVEVLATVNSPRTSPKTSPKNSPAHSPRSSTTNLQGSSF